MKRLVLSILISVTGLVFPLLEVIAQEDIGKKEYEANCSICHGLTGKGDGPFAVNLNLEKSVPSLTILSKENNGVFPVQKVYEIIDGRAKMRMHGAREMPIWGDEYKEESYKRYGSKEHMAASLIRRRILGLIEYIKSLQES